MREIKLEELEEFDNGGFNTLPSHFKSYDFGEEDAYKAYQSVSYFCVSDSESRQIYSNPENRFSEMFRVRIYWINKHVGFGWGILDNTIEDKLKLLIFGHPENISRFRNVFGAQFRGDNS